MINKLIDAISLKLHAEFGDDYKIYTEEVKQGLKTPCFFINTSKNEEDLFRNNRYYQTNPFIIQYLPSEGDEKYKCNDVKERLFNSLEYVTIKEKNRNGETIESLVRGTNMSGEYAEGILNFMINYNMFVYKEEEQADKMDACSYDNNVKG